MEYKITTAQIAKILNVSEKALLGFINDYNKATVKSISRNELISLVKPTNRKYYTAKSIRLINDLEDYLFPVTKENYSCFQIACCKKNPNVKVLKLLDTVITNALSMNSTEFNN